MKELLTGDKGKLKVIFYCTIKDHTYHVSTHEIGPHGNTESYSYK